MIVSIIVPLNVNSRHRWIAEMAEDEGFLGPIQAVNAYLI